jgi:hypothetical protein
MDHRLVQCFGTKRRPHKEDKSCRRRFLWTSKAGGTTRFGRKGTQACPHCGTLPDFRHPLNRALSGEFGDDMKVAEDKAASLMPAYIELLEKEKAEK